jgi:hypothetical protein
MKRGLIYQKGNYNLSKLFLQKTTLILQEIDGVNIQQCLKYLIIEKILYCIKFNKFKVQIKKQNYFFVKVTSSIIIYNLRVSALFIQFMKKILKFFKKKVFQCSCLHRKYLPD